MVPFEFHNPTRLVIREGCISMMGPELKTGGFKKALCIFGGNSARQNGSYEQLKSTLHENGILMVETWGVQANPVLSKVREMIALGKKEKVDCIVACGGGSVIDSAKAVSAGLHVEDVWDIYERKVSVKEATPIFTILTLSATGSEMNCGSVLTNEDEKKKWAFLHPLVTPVLSLIDPVTHTFLPWIQSANGAIDAMSHIHEYYFSPQSSQTALCVNEGLLKSIIRTTNAIYQDEKDADLRADFAWAATLALNGISGAGLGHGDWGTHMIEHGVSALFPQVAHGEGLGVIFPAWILYNQHKNPVIFQRWAKEVMGEDSVEKGVEALRKLYKSWNRANTLKELGITQEDLLPITENILMAGNPGGYFPLTKEDILKILDLCK